MLIGSVPAGHACADADSLALSIITHVQPSCGGRESECAWGTALRTVPPSLVSLCAQKLCRSVICITNVILTPIPPQLPFPSSLSPRGPWGEGKGENGYNAVQVGRTESGFAASPESTRTLLMLGKA
jgi:hypothetical protein